MPLLIEPLIWLDASDLNTIEGDISAVTNWKDKSGNSLDFDVTRGTPYWYSFLHSPSIYLQVGETIGRIGSGLPSTTYPMSIYMVYRDLWSTAGRTSLLSGRHPNDSTSAINDLWLGSWSVSNWMRFRWDGGGSRRTDQFGSGRVINQSYILSDRHDNSQSKHDISLYREDGNTSNQSYSSSLKSNRVYSWSIGGNGSYNLARALHTFEVLIFSRYLSTTDHDLLMNYLKEKHGFA
jgi:hypothetical protein